MGLSLGIGLGMTHQRGAGAGLLDLASLSWDLLVYPDFTASPWEGQASAGTSGTHDLTEATNPPAASDGDAVFDGANDTLGGATCSDLITTTNFSGIALVNIPAIGTDSATLINNDCIFCIALGDDFFVYLRSSGVVGLATETGVLNSVTTAFTTGAWQLVQFKSDGSNNYIRVNDGAWSSGAGGTITGLGVALAVMRSSSSRYAEGTCRVLGLSKQCFDDATFDAIYESIAATYGGI